MVLTVEVDPTGLDAVPSRGLEGQAAGVINTSEQLGGAVGIAVLTAILVGNSEHRTEESLAENAESPHALIRFLSGSEFAS